MLCLRSFEPLRRRETVLGEEGENRASGLCNAVILSAPDSTDRYLKDLDVHFIRSVDTNFNRLARRFLE